MAIYLVVYGVLRTAKTSLSSVGFNHFHGGVGLARTPPSFVSKTCCLMAVHGAIFYEGSHLRCQT